MNRYPLVVAMAVSAPLSLATFAADINMNADDVLTNNESSFNTNLHWSNGLAPSAGNNYFTNDFLLRTPADATADFTFAGDSLTVNGLDNAISTTTVAGTDLSDAFMFKGTLAGTTTFTINNFTVNGAALRQANNDAQIFRITGNSFTVGANGMAVHIQGPTYIDSPINGSGRIVIYDQGSDSTARVLHFTSPSNTYSGSIHLVTANRSRFALDSTGVMKFVVGASGVNNSISGAGSAVLDGTFVLDLSGADTTYGNSWTLVSNSTVVETYGASFNVAGFSDPEADNVWVSGDGNFSFSELTGILTYIGNRPDVDSDDLPDDWELLYFRSTPEESEAAILAKYTKSSNPDGDAFDNLAEFNGGSNPTIALSVPGDIDADGMDDTWEMSNFGNLAQTATGDFDADFGTNLQEFLDGSDPKARDFLPDGDGDGLSNYWEIHYFGNTTSQSDGDDPDGDGYNNYSEMFAGYANDPTKQFSSPDSDSDGLPDGWEVHYFIQGGENAAADLGTIIGRHLGTADPDLDGFNNAAEFAALSDPTVAASVPGDADADGLNDGWETTYFGDLSQGASGDFDNDGATNLAEFLAGSNPASAASVPQTFTPYSVDANTLHLWHFNETAAPALDSATSGGLTLGALGGLATLNNTGLAGLDKALNTSGGTGAYLAPVALTTDTTTDAVTTQITNASTNAFSLEAVVRVDFNPVQTVARNMQILSFEGDIAPVTSRFFHFRLQTQASGVPILNFNNLSGGSSHNFNLPLTGDEAIVQGGWYHVAVTFTGAPNVAGNLKVYWTRMRAPLSSATLLGTAQQTAILPSSPTGMFVVGNEGRSLNSSGGFTESFVGLIDEVRVSSVERSASGFYFSAGTPAAPTAPQAVAGNGSVALSWTASAGATTYTIKRSTTSGSGYVAISSGAVSGTTYTDSNAVNGTTYFYVISAVNGSGESANSTQVSATPVSLLQSWRILHFGSSANSGSGADVSDADNDGLANLLEYALGTNPKTANASGITVAPVGGVLTLSFAHGADSSLTYVIEATNDLSAAWTPVHTFPAFTTSGSATFTDTAPLTSGTRRFLRLRISY